MTSISSITIFVLILVVIDFVGMILIFVVIIRMLIVGDSNKVGCDPSALVQGDRLCHAAVPE